MENNSIDEYVRPDGRLYYFSPWVSWSPKDETICLDGCFTVEELEAFASYMRSHGTA